MQIYNYRDVDGGFTSSNKRITTTKKNSSKSIKTKSIHASRELTSVGKELRVDVFEGLLPHHSRRTFGLKAAIKSLDFLLREARHATQGSHGLWTVTRGRFQLL